MKPVYALWFVSMLCCGISLHSIQGDTKQKKAAIKRNKQNHVPQSDYSWREDGKKIVAGTAVAVTLVLCDYLVQWSCGLKK